MINTPTSARDLAERVLNGLLVRNVRMDENGRIRRPWIRARRRSAGEVKSIVIGFIGLVCVVMAASASAT
ncbi:hypothetical protein K0817_002295 [Microbacterium sp. HD4P20]|uniref:hypothetical protein n=1 Tax=Microbacterium sp. HD4P20 TaxID=2864874 RepID=UPI001C63D8DA|nr:hypothetical protein [Microbacterium sp. HD4P20]MCP2635393.1 hypothetical protein [Microbacterium sp. HD4P20]